MTLPINVSSSGDNIVIQGNASSPTIQVVGMFFQCSAAGILTIKTGSVPQTGPMNFALSGGLNLLNNGNVYFQCNNGDSLVFHLQVGLGSLNVAGQIMFYQF